MPRFTPEQVHQAHARIDLQQRLGLEVRWVDGDEVDAMNPCMAPGQTLGASYPPGDGYLEPACNVLAHTTALFTSDVHVFERTSFTGLQRHGGRIVGVTTTAGPVTTERVVMTGGMLSRRIRLPSCRRSPTVRTTQGGCHAFNAGSTVSPPEQ